MKRLAVVFALVAVAACNNSPPVHDPSGTDDLSQHGL